MGASLQPGLHSGLDQIPILPQPCRLPGLRYIGFCLITEWAIKISVTGYSTSK